MEDIYIFFRKLKSDKLKRIYDKDIEKIAEMMENLYRCCFRFNLTIKQTEFMLEESLRPFLGTWIEDDRI